MTASVPISESELAALKVLWEHGPATVREVDAILRKQGRRWAYTTVLTLLQRLLAKGYARSDTNEVAHVFHATRTREEFLRQRLRGLADQLCEGVASPLVLALVDGVRLSDAETDQLRKLLDRIDAVPPGGKGRKRT